MVNYVEVDKKIEKYWDKQMLKYKDLISTFPKSEDLTNIDLTRVEWDNMKFLASIISFLNKSLKTGLDNFTKLKEIQTEFDSVKEESKKWVEDIVGVEK